MAPDGRASVETTLDRPLHNAKPWRYHHMFHSEGLAPEAFEPTDDGSCVPYQLHKLVKKRGQPVWSQNQLDRLLRGIALDLYPDEDLYELLGDHGCTARMVLELCKREGVAVHIL